MKKQSACPPARRGSGLIFAVVLLFVILGMVITLSSVTVLETKMSQKTKSSVGAFYNSESGVEWALNQIATTTNPDSAIGSRFTMSGNKASCPGSIGGSNVCSLYLLDSGGNVLNSAAKVSEIKAVRSVGTQGGDTQRAIEAAVASSDEVYRISCAHDGLPGPNPLLMCCRIKVATGETVCRDTPGGSWSNYPSQPWDSSVAGPWDISCGHDENLSFCCRTNTISGATNCRSYQGSWTDYTDPWN